MLEALHIHEPEHPGFLRHALECRKIGVDGGGGPAGVAQQFGHGHHVMAPQAAPAAGLQYQLPCLNAGCDASASYPAYIYRSDKVLAPHPAI